MSTYVYLGWDRIYSCGCVWRNYGRGFVPAGEPRGLVPCERHTPHKDGLAR